MKQELPREHFHKVAQGAIDAAPVGAVFPAGAAKMAGDIGWNAYLYARFARRNPETAAVDAMAAWLEKRQKLGSNTPMAS